MKYQNNKITKLCLNISNCIMFKERGNYHKNLEVANSRIRNNTK